MAAKSVELNSFGDKELRICRGTIEGGEWVLPLLIVFYRGGGKEYAKIAPAVGLHPEQARILEYYFSIYNRWGHKDCFLIERKHLAELTETVSGITPSYYYKWPGRDLPAIKEKVNINGEELKKPIPDEADDFLEFVHRKCRIDRNVLRLAWSSVAEYATEWMVKRRRPIDLGFVTLHAFPFRANWKEILLSRLPPKWFFAQLEPDKKSFRSTLGQADFIDELTSLHMLAIKTHGNTLHWTMEAVPSEQFEEEVLKMEQLKKAGGNTNYVRFYEALISKLSGRVLEVVAAYLKKTMRAFPKLLCGDLDGSKKLVPHRGQRELLPDYGKGIDVHIVNGVAGGFGKTGKFGTLSQEVARLSKVPSLFRLNNAVREPVEPGGVDMDRSGAGEAGANGLHVLPAGEGDPAGRELLALQSGPTNEPVADGT